MLVRTVLVVGFCLLAGCSQPDAGQPDDGTEPPVDGGDSPTPVPGAPPETPVAARPPTHLLGTECVESGASTPGVPGSFGERVPEGWAASGVPVTFVTERLFSCARISWGDLERPAFALWEFHESMTAPETCREEGDFNAGLATVWFSDPELVALARSFGMPAHLGTFALDRQDSGGVQTWTWEWSEPGGGPSMLTFADNPPDLSGSQTQPYRFFWFVGGGVGYYDFDLVETRNQATTPAATGTLSPPMLYANGTNPAFAGTAVVAPVASFSGEIHQFEDLQCLTPR